MKVVQISGIKGILSVVFIGSCLIAGFVGFPGLIAMCAWNWVANNYFLVPEINIFQGILLWAIVALIYFIADNKALAVSIARPDQLNEEEMKWLMQKIKKAEMRHRLMQDASFITKETLETKECPGKSHDTGLNIKEEEKEKITK